jgi:universal stress protein family protein
MFESILVGTDGSDAAGVAVSRAVAMAAALDARLQIVSAYEPVPERRLRIGLVQVPTDVQVNMRDEVLALLEEARQTAQAAGVTKVETFARLGDAADAILDVAEEQSSDRGRQQGHDRSDALPAGLGAQQGLASRPLLGADRPHRLSRGRPALRASPASGRSWLWWWWSWWAAPGAQRAPWPLRR